MVYCMKNNNGNTKPNRNGLRYSHVFNKLRDMEFTVSYSNFIARYVIDKIGEVADFNDMDFDLIDKTINEIL